MRITAKAIHDELQRLGHYVHVEKGDGYFFFSIRKRELGVRFLFYEADKTPLHHLPSPRPGARHEKRKYRNNYFFCGF